MEKNRKPLTSHSDPFVESIDALPWRSIMNRESGLRGRGVYYTRCDPDMYVTLLGYRQYTASFFGALAYVASILYVYNLLKFFLRHTRSRTVV